MESNYFFDDRFEVLAFERGGAGFGARGKNVGEDFRVGESGGLGFKYLGGHNVR